MFIKRNNIYLSYILLICTFLIWGSLYIVSKVALKDIPPFTLLMLRYVFSVIILGIISWRRGFIRIKKEHLKYFLFIGGIGYFGAIAFQLIGTRLIPASTSALVNSLNPVTIPICAAIFLHEKITFRKVICTLISLFGVYIILSSKEHHINSFGILSGLISVSLWSITAIVIRKIGNHYGSIQLALYGMCISLIFAIPASCIEICLTPWRLTSTAFISALYMAIVCTALAQTLWNKCLINLEASKCSMFYPLQTLFSAILGIIFLREVITSNFIIGAILISLGIILSVYNFPNANIKRL